MRFAAINSSILLANVLIFMAFVVCAEQDKKVDFWSYSKPEKIKVPGKFDWGYSEIDSFIFEKIKLTLTEDNEGELGWGAAAAGNGNSHYNYNNNNNNTNTNANANASGGRGDQQEDMIFEYQPAQPGGH